MTIRAFIADGLAGFRTQISLVLMDAGGRPERIMHLHPGGPMTYDEIGDGLDLEPTLVLDEAAARALLDGLAGHFHGAEDTRALRKDYDAERKRVDGLIGTVTHLAGVLAEPAPAQYRMSTERP
jgi:hypothetical protein